MGNNKIDYKHVVEINASGADRDLSLLELLEKNGSAPHYACKAGFCGSCAVTVISGKAEHFKDAIGYHDDDQVLSCISRVKSQVITVGH